MANDVELPPTSSNLNWLMEEDELYKDSPLKGLLAQMAKGARGPNKVSKVPKQFKIYGNRQITVFIE